MAAKRVGAGKLLASALSARLDCTVVTYDQYLREKDSGVQFEEIGFREVFGYGHVTVPPPPAKRETKSWPVKAGDDNFQIFVKMMSGRCIAIDVKYRDTVEELKIKIERWNGIAPKYQRLIFGGRQLQDDRRLSDYKIERESTVFLVHRLCGGAPPVKYYINDPEMLDPSYDFDFTNMSDGLWRSIFGGTAYSRAGMPYYRPCGWEGFALKVLGKYGDDVWLGEDGIRTDSSDGEWPVSYHGTNVEVMENIVKEGYDLSKAKNERFGSGIYSSPSVSVAGDYAQMFPHDGARFKLVLQNRVSREGLEIHHTPTHGEYWVQPDDSLIRPYGLCFKVVSSFCTLS